MENRLTFEIKNKEGQLVGSSNCLPKASAVYDLAERLAQPLAVYVRNVKLLDTQTLQNMLAA